MKIGSTDVWAAVVLLYELMLPAAGWSGRHSVRLAAAAPLYPV